MHIPDGYLSPETYVPFYGVSLSIWAVALKKMKKTLSTRHIPYLAMASAFSFLIMMFNVPIPNGTTGHAVGGGIIAILLGPWTAVIAVTVSLIIQALVFGDGGITCLGANSFNMAIVLPFVSYWAFNLIRGRSVSGPRLYIAGFLSGWLGLSVAAACCGTELGIQPLIAHGPGGRPLYAPYPLKVAFPAMVLGHMGAFSIVEGAITALVLVYFVKHEPDMIYAFRRKEA